MNEKYDFLVSIRLTAYNEAKYISAALDGIMMQEVDFPVEVVVGDDFSTDRTLEIVRSYKDTQFIKIKILDRKAGDEYYVERKKYGWVYNFLDTARHCKGKYIAMLDGDDYWIDPNKLASQVHFLESHPDYTMSSHEVFKPNPFEKKSLTNALQIMSAMFRLGQFSEIMRTLKLAVTFNEKFWLRKTDHPEAPRDYHVTFEKMLFMRLYQPMSAIVIRRSVVDMIPDWFAGIDHSHYAIILSALVKGKSYHFKNYFGVYRINEGSMTQTQTFTKAGKMTYKKDMVLLLTYLKDLVNPSQREAIDRRLEQINRE